MEGSHNTCMCLLVVIISCNGCFGCLDEERVALLEFKASIKGPLSDPLLTWVDDSNSDCCSWERVKCNNTTKRVTRLSLDETNVYSEDNRILFLNASLFLPFEELQHLDLSRNYINGWQNKEGFGKLSKLKKLEVLCLRLNYLKNEMLRSLGALSSLKTLDLRSNLLEGSLSDFFEAFTNLSNLEVLDLSFNLLDSFLPFHDLRNMTKLMILDLGENNFSGGAIPPSILSLISLQRLSLRNTDVKDSLSGFCALKKLQELDLSTNEFHGIIPPCFTNLTSLGKLDLSYNKLTGHIAPSLLSNLTSLKHILLSDNPFQGTFSFPSPIDPKFQLNFLDLSNCNLNISTTDLLAFLFNQHDMRQIDLSDNHIRGNFPNWLLNNNTKLETLILANNSLGGHLLFPAYLKNLRSVDLSNNQIQGKLQENIGNILPSLYYFNLTNNGLKGRIPSSLGNLKDLGLLDLSGNGFSGGIPESLALKCKNMGSLILSKNRLDGRISPRFFNMTSLHTLRLNNNLFTGNIPNDDVGFSPLYTIDLSQNQISGSLPNWIGRLKQLTSLVARANSFSGPIPTELCNLASMRLLDLSENQLSGSIPSCQTLISLQYIHLQRNKLTGGLPKAFLTSSDLLALDLRYNNFSGSIPTWFELLSDLRILLLRENSFSGPIPNEMCRLKKIGILDLSHNMFSGPIPPCFSNMSFGKIEAGEPLFGSRIFSGGYSLTIDKYRDLMEGKRFNIYYFMQYTEQEEAEFMTKKISGSYKGEILNFMAGMDLSSNQLTGEIPAEIGDLTVIRALNLSNNQFKGPIPKTLSRLEQLESLDLSHNKLSGEIPEELTSIYTLAVFTVAYNNLSGQIPDMKAQFSTFGETSYQGNTFLCGALLHKQCGTTTESTTDRLGSSDESGIDFPSFLSSFAASYAVSLLVLVFVLYINPYWRQVWFHLIDVCLRFMFPFLY